MLFFTEVIRDSITAGGSYRTQECALNPYKVCTASRWNEEWPNISEVTLESGQSVLLEIAYDVLLEQLEQFFEQYPDPGPNCVCAAHRVHQLCGPGCTCRGRSPAEARADLVELNRRMGLFDL